MIRLSDRGAHRDLTGAFLPSLIGDLVPITGMSTSALARAAPRTGATTLSGRNAAKVFTTAPDEPAIALVKGRLWGTRRRSCDKPVRPVSDQLSDVCWSIRGSGPAPSSPAGRG